MPAQKTGNGNLHENPKVVTLEVATGNVDVNEDLSGLSIQTNSDYIDVPASTEFNSVENLEVNLDSYDSSNPQVGETDPVLVNVSTENSAIAGVPENETVRIAEKSTVASQTNVNNTEKTNTAIKRQMSASSSSSPVVTKVIITKNPNTSQPQAVPVQLNQVIQGQSLSSLSMAPGISIISQGSNTPTKTITISPHGIVSPGKQVLTVQGSPSKVGIPVSKIPISPSKTPTKITMIPIGKSPQRIAPAAGAVSMLPKNIADITPVTIGTNTVTVSRPTVNMITMSPSKVIRQGTVVQQRPSHIQIQPSQTLVTSGGQIVTQQPGVKQMTIPLSNVHPVQGSKFQYVRLVTPSSQGKLVTPMTSLVQGKTLVPVSNSTGSTVTLTQQPPQMKITLPVQGSQVVTKPVITQTSSQSVQRILLPAPNQVSVRMSSAGTSATPTTLAQIRPATAPGLGQLPPGTTILSAGGSTQGLQGFALVPASYVAQLQQQMNSKPTQSQQQQTSPSLSPQGQQSRQEFIPIASSDPSVSATVMARNSLNGMNGSPIEPTGARPRKPCNCTKSQCLKLYCDCFANGEFCHNCNCNNCANNLEHEEERSKAIKSCLDRNPMAFHPKIGKGKGRDGEGDRRHNKGCNCKRSGCLKNYCECYEAKIMCSSSCKCMGCKNFEESPERKTLMHLADAAEVRVQQQTAAKTKLSSQISGVPSRPPVSSATGERLPYTFITAEVAEATCACLLAQAEEAERMKMPPVVQERMVIEEFGRCLLQIIESANKTKESDVDT